MTNNNRTLELGVLPVVILYVCSETNTQPLNSMSLAATS